MCEHVHSVGHYGLVSKREKATHDHVLIMCHNKLAMFTFTAILAFFLAFGFGFRESLMLLKSAKFTLILRLKTYLMLI